MAGGRKSFNVRVPLVRVSWLVAAAVVSGATCVFVLPGAWETVAGVWNPIAELLSAGMVRGSSLPKLACPHLSGLGPWEAFLRLLEGTHGSFGLLCMVTVVGAVAYALAKSMLAYAEHYDGAWAGPAPAGGASTMGDARLVAAPGAVSHVTRGWRRGSVPEGGTLVVGSNGRDELRLLEGVHFCVIGRSGEGKSRRVILSTIVANVLQGKTVVVNDVKGELAAWVSTWAKGIEGLRFVWMRLDEPGYSDVRWDPLARARACAEAGDVGGATSALLELARCVVKVSGNERDPYFADAARKVFVGLALYVLTSPDVPDECRNIASVAAAITPTGDQGPMDRLDALRRSLPDDSPIHRFIGMVSGERGGGPGVLASLLKDLAPFLDEEIDVIMHDDELDLASLATTQTLLLVTSSSAKGDRSSLTSALYSQVLASLRLGALESGGRLSVPAVVVMDEFASLGRNERLLQDIGEVRGEGISIVACWQSLDQLQGVSHYGREEAKALLDQFHNKAILSGCGLSVSTELSRTIGDYTCIAEGTSATKSVRGGSTGTSSSLTRRALITPDELEQWRASKNGMLLITPDGTFALESRDVSRTFVADLLGMGPDGSGDDLRRRAFEGRVLRNTEHPRVWRGVTPQRSKERRDTEDEDAPASVLDGDLLPEGF